MSVHPGTRGGFNILINLINASYVWSSLTRAQKAALKAWPVVPSKRVADNLRSKGLVNAEGGLTDAGMFVCWVELPDERKPEFEPEGGWFAQPVSSLGEGE